MYEMFTGSPPYQGKDPITILYQHVQGQVVPPHEHNPSLSPELEEIILTSMSVDPENRYQDIDTMREHLQAVLKQEVG
jgi:serine/threonine-protein kinase